MNNKKYFVIGIIVVLIFVVIGYFVLIKDDKNNKSITKIEDDEIEKIVNEEMYLLAGKNSISELNNSEKLWYCFDNLVDDYPETFKGYIIENCWKKTSFNNDIVLENIKYYSSNDVIYNYDSEKDTYTKNANFNAKAYNNVKPAYTKIEKINSENGKYTVSVKYLWYYAEPSDGITNVYGSYDAALNQKEKLNNDEIHTFDIDKELAESLIKGNEIETYTYVFEKKDNKVVLIDFSK